MTTYDELPEEAYEKVYYVARLKDAKGKVIQDGDKVLYQEKGNLTRLEWIC